MRTIFWGFRILIFLFLLLFAAKNTEPVSVRFFFDILWEAPFIVVLLAFFVLGAALGALSLVGTVWGLRREAAGLKREIKRERTQWEKARQAYEAQRPAEG